MNANNLSSEKAKVKSFANKKFLSHEWNQVFGEKSPLLISLEEAGRLLSLDSRTIRRLSQKGELPPLRKIGHSIRISYPDLMNYFQNGSWKGANA